MKTKGVCVRVPLDVLAQVDVIAEAEGSTRSAALVALLRAGIVGASAERVAVADDVVRVVSAVVSLYQDKKAPRR